MNKICIIASVLLLGLCNTNSLVAQSKGDNIVDNIEQSANHKVKIILPKELKNRIDKKSGSQVNAPKKESSTGVGYRVQIFSDNNSTTAKREAQSKESAIATRFPMLRTYITYKAPAWRLRVGDFRTKEEAKDMMHQLKQAFPSYSREMTIVMDRINSKIDDEN